MKRSAAAIVTLVVGVLVALVPVGAASARTASGCATAWGSQAKSATELGVGPLTRIRAGRHVCFDRLVIEGGAGWNHVEYVDQVRTDGAGLLVPVRGGARLQVITTAGHDDMYRPTYDLNTSELVDVRGFRTFRQVAGAGSFEGHGTIGLGVRARLPFRVLSIAGPGDDNRLVIDVAHRW